MFPPQKSTPSTASLDSCLAVGSLPCVKSQEGPLRIRLTSALTHTSAFSLLEMLVTIAIIAVLAALSIPVLGAYRKSAQKTQCIANLKQLSLAFTSYSAENNGLIPGPVIQAGDIWLISLPLYFDRTNQDLVDRASPFSCPAARNEYKAPNFTPTYSMNGSLMEVGPLGYSQVRLQSFTQPSKTALIMDGQLALMPPYWLHHVGYGGDFPNKRDFVHDGSINILFADGHVETRKEEQIPRSGSDPFWKHNVE
jgi:prepilin-type processing-associated H-X9-DG protein/prepilin-type N-terminal cleavage/methylation domain-containing protein